MVGSSQLYSCSHQCYHLIRVRVRVRVKDVLIRYASGSIYPSTHFFDTNVGSSSHPALEYFSEDMTCAISVQAMSVITILCSMLLVYDIGLT